MDLETFKKVNKGFAQIERIPTPQGNVLVAETFLASSREYPWGHWKVVWAIERDGMDMGRWLEIDGMHDSDKNWTVDQKRQARINSAVEDAMAWMKDNLESGRYH